MSADQAKRFALALARQLSLKDPAGKRFIDPEGLVSKALFRDHIQFVIKALPNQQLKETLLATFDTYVNDIWSAYTTARAESSSSSSEGSVDQYPECWFSDASFTESVNQINKVSSVTDRLAALQRLALIPGSTAPARDAYARDVIASLSQVGTTREQLEQGLEMISVVLAPSPIAESSPVHALLGEAIVMTKLLASLEGASIPPAAPRIYASQLLYRIGAALYGFSSLPEDDIDTNSSSFKKFIPSPSQDLTHGLVLPPAHRKVLAGVLVSLAVTEVRACPLVSTSNSTTKTGPTASSTTSSSSSSSSTTPFSLAESSARSLLSFIAWVNDSVASLSLPSLLLDTLECLLAGVTIPTASLLSAHPALRFSSSQPITPSSSATDTSSCPLPLRAQETLLRASLITDLVLTGLLQSFTDISSSSASYAAGTSAGLGGNSGLAMSPLTALRVGRILSSFKSLGPLMTRLQSWYTTINTKSAHSNTSSPSMSASSEGKHPAQLTPDQLYVSLRSALINLGKTLKHHAGAISTLKLPIVLAKELETGVVASRRKTLKVQGKVIHELQETIAKAKSVKKENIKEEEGEAREGEEEKLTPEAMNSLQRELNELQLKRAKLKQDMESNRPVMKTYGDLLKAIEATDNEVQRKKYNKAGTKPEGEMTQKVVITLPAPLDHMIATEYAGVKRSSGDGKSVSSSSSSGSSNTSSGSGMSWVSKYVNEDDHSIQGSVKGSLDAIMKMTSSSGSGEEEGSIDNSSRVGDNDSVDGMGDMSSSADLFFVDTTSNDINGGIKGGKGGKSENVMNSLSKAITDIIGDEGEYGFADEGMYMGENGEEGEGDEGELNEEEGGEGLLAARNALSRSIEQLQLNKQLAKERKEEREKKLLQEFEELEEKEKNMQDNDDDDDDDNDDGNIVMFNDDGEEEEKEEESVDVVAGEDETKDAGRYNEDSDDDDNGNNNTLGSQQGSGNQDDDEEETEKKQADENVLRMELELAAVIAATKGVEDDVELIEAATARGGRRSSRVSAMKDKTPSSSQVEDSAVEDVETKGRGGKTATKRKRRVDEEEQEEGEQDGEGEMVDMEGTKGKGNGNKTKGKGKAKEEVKENVVAELESSQSPRRMTRRGSRAALEAEKTKTDVEEGEEEGQREGESSRSRSKRRTKGQTTEGDDSEVLSQSQETEKPRTSQRRGSRKG